MPPDPNLVNLAKGIAAAHSLDPDLVCAVIEQESAWNPWEFRYEPGFLSAYIAPMLTGTSPAGKIVVFDPSCSIQTEAYARAFSWGLMQILGQVAREQGFTGGWLSQLADPATGIEYGCRKLAACLKNANGNETNALQSWNGGGNPLYASQVLARVGNYA